jgi:hypothetical protein
MLGLREQVAHSDVHSLSRLGAFVLRHSADADTGNLDAE